MDAVESLLPILPEDSESYIWLNEWVRGAREVKAHNDTVNQTKSLQSFIDPQAYKATYENTIHAVEKEGIIDPRSELGKKIKEASDAMTRKLLAESRTK